MTFYRYVSIPILFLLTTLVITSLIVNADVDWLGYNREYCEFEIVYPDYVILVCRFDILKTDNGLALYIDTSKTGFNKIIIERYYSVFAMDWRLSAQFTYANSYPSGGVVEINLPLGYDYAGLPVIGWNLTIVWIYSDGSTLLENHILDNTACPSMHCQAVHTDSRPYIIQLKPILTNNTAEIPAPQPPAWNDISGWVSYLSYLAGTFGSWASTAMQILTTAVGYLLNIVPYLGFFIPLHIIGGFIQGIDKGVAVINFYIGLGRRIFDLFVKVVQAIIEAIDNVLPT